MYLGTFLQHLENVAGNAMMLQIILLQLLCNIVATRSFSAATHYRLVADIAETFLQHLLQQACNITLTMHTMHTTQSEEHAVLFLQERYLTRECEDARSTSEKV
jgi:hypothetical protein